VCVHGPNSQVGVLHLAIVPTLSTQIDWLEVGNLVKCEFVIRIALRDLKAAPHHAFPRPPQASTSPRFLSSASTVGSRPRNAL
jgi:hypothetical protein